MWLHMKLFYIVTSCFFSMGVLWG